MLRVHSGHHPLVEVTQHGSAAREALERHVAEPSHAELVGDDVGTPVERPHVGLVEAGAVGRHEPPDLLLDAQRAHERLGALDVSRVGPIRQHEPSVGRSGVTDEPGEAAEEHVVALPLSGPHEIGRGVHDEARGMEHREVRLADGIVGPAFGGPVAGRGAERGDVDDDGEVER